MLLAAGARLGPYEVQAKLGEGGMGEVYRARDTRLDRTVAIKVVRTDFSERFEREARAISALNHPHICTLHDVGRTGEYPYLVMEYIDGAPIAGPLSIGDVLKLGSQICDALHAAHHQGIVHRDLKPANIMTAKGGIKLLDFGLAKPHAPNMPSIGDQATVSALTGAHTVLGTPQYMAPEQIEGREVDARTDIFAFGCVLYELVTGKRAFDGKTASSVMAAVLATDPRKPSELVPVTPPQLDWIILRCLEKDPEARWQSARDVGMQLRWLGEHQSAVSATTRGPGRRSFLTGIAAGILVTGILAGMGIWSGSLMPSPSSGSLDQIAMRVPAPPKISVVGAGTASAIAVSPDGRTIAFVGGTFEADSAIYVRALDQFEPAKVDGTDGATTVFFSPDGRWLGFHSGGKVRKVPTGGGASVEICDAQALRGIAWLDDDSIVFTPRPTSGLMRVRAQGGTPAALTSLDASKHERTHRSPIGLPGSRVVVFVAGSNEIDTYDDGRIVALTLDTGTVTELVRGYAPAYSAGHLLYVYQGTVFAVPLDPVTLKLGGSPVQVLKDVSTLPGWGTADFGVSPNGVLAYVPGGDRTELAEVGLIYRNGSIQPTGVAGPFGRVRMSPDGRRLALLRVGANNAVWMYDIERRQQTRITDRLDVESITWNHDGAGVTYSTGPDVRSMAVDGSGAEEIVIPATVVNGRSFTPVRWSRDGQTLALTIRTPGQASEVALYSRRDRSVRTVVNSRYFESATDMSPDGRWLAYFSSDTGGRQLYVHDLASGTKHLVPSGRIWEAGWTKAGRELVAVGPDGALAVPFMPGSPPAFGTPEQLFMQAKGTKLDVPQVLGGAFGGDAAPDGSRFAVLFDKPRPPLTEIRVVTNWTRQLADLKP